MHSSPGGCSRVNAAVTVNRQGGQQEKLWVRCLCPEGFRKSPLTFQRHATLFAEEGRQGSLKAKSDLLLRKP